MNKGKRPIGKILMILSVVFFYLPILYMIIFSFNDGKSLTSFTGFSLRRYDGCTVDDIQYRAACDIYLNSSGNNCSDRSQQVEETDT